MKKNMNRFSRKYNDIIRDIERIKERINIISSILSTGGRRGKGKLKR